MSHLTTKPNPRVDYDKIADLYDEPSRDHIPDPTLAEYLDIHPGQSRTAIWILDVGCGTGKQLHANREQYPHIKMVGMDLFHGMLRQAQKRNDAILWVQGDGASLPLQNNQFDYIVNQYVYPHIQNKKGFLSEIFRVVKTSGWFIIKNIDPWAMSNWILYRYFPAARDMDEQDFLPVPQLVEMMQQAGFAEIDIQRERRETMETLTDFLDFASQRHRASHFMALSDQDYLAGIRQLHHELQESFGKTPLVRSEMCFITIRGKKR